MTWIKICGITNLEDALTAVEAGADAVGFVFYERSPRRVEVETAREIVNGLPAGVEKVGVFAGEALRHRLEIAAGCGLNATQVYLQDPIGYEGGGTKASSLYVYYAIPAAWLVAGRLRGAFRPPLDTIFIDSGNGEQYGGTGVPFDWSAAAQPAKELGQDVKFVIAGGLNAENVVTAMRTLKPFGVDVASGVEILPGKKDPAKVRAFINAVRAEDKLA
jgi:phosphoribosylanthranilate isomerase